jgi:hypothetical protein
VVKKIGVYEKIEDDSEIFDLSTFSEGSLCLFDVYEKNPSLILELEDTETQTNSNSLKEDVFDFLLTKINDSEPEKQVELTKKSYKDILELLKSKKKEDSEDNKIITNLLNLIKKTIGDKKYYGEDTQDKIKKYATDFKKRILSLIVTEPFLGLRFIFTKDGEPIDDSEFREWSIKSEIKEYVIVSENFDVIETYPADSLDSKYTLPESNVETKEFKSDADESNVELKELKESKESKVKKYSSSSKGTPRGTSLNAASLPRGTSLNAQIVKEPKQETLSAIMEVNEPDSKTESKPKSRSKAVSKAVSKAESKAVSKPESKAVSKAESKAEGEEVDLNAGIDYSEPESKPKSKAKSLSKSDRKSESESEGYNLDLNSVDEPVTSESKKSKLKAPGASIRPKSSQKKITE